MIICNMKFWDTYCFIGSFSYIIGWLTCFEYFVARFIYYWLATEFKCGELLYQPQVTLSVGTVIAVLFGAIVLMIGTVYLMKRVNAFFTKRLLLYKFNKVN